MAKALAGFSTSGVTLFCGVAQDFDSIRNIQHELASRAPCLWSFASTLVFVKRQGGQAKRFKKGIVLARSRNNIFLQINQGIIYDL